MPRPGIRARLSSAPCSAPTDEDPAYSPLFNPAFPEQAKALLKEKLQARYAWLDEQLAGRAYLTGDEFTVPDAYLYVVTHWAAPMKIDLSAYRNVGSFMARMAERPAVRKALADEGLS